MNMLQHPARHIAALLLLSACASTSGPNQKGHAESQPTEWPPSVAAECPDRKTSVECFREGGSPSAAFQVGMSALTEHLERCKSEQPEAVSVRLTIETRGGRPTCVDPSVWVAPLEKYQSLRWLSDERKTEAEVARCAAEVFARHFVLPDSAESEHCRWTSRFLF